MVVEKAIDFCDHLIEIAEMLDANAKLWLYSVLTFFHAESVLPNSNQGTYLSCPYQLMTLLQDVLVGVHYRQNQSVLLSLLGHSRTYSVLFSSISGLFALPRQRPIPPGPAGNAKGISKTLLRRTDCHHVSMRGRDKTLQNPSSFCSGLSALPRRRPVPPGPACDADRLPARAAERHRLLATAGFGRAGSVKVRRNRRAPFLGLNSPIGRFDCLLKWSESVTWACKDAYVVTSESKHEVARLRGLRNARAVDGAIDSRTPRLLT